MCLLDTFVYVGAHMKLFWRILMIKYTPTYNSRQMASNYEILCPLRYTNDVLRGIHKFSGRAGAVGAFTPAQWLLSIGDPWSLILPKIWFFRHFIALINIMINGSQVTSNASMAQLARALIKSSLLNVVEVQIPPEYFDYFSNFPKL